MKYIVTLFLILIGSGRTQSPDFSLSDNIPPSDHNREIEIMSAFFGLDNALPRTSIGLSREAPGKDGMPIVFSHELNPTTLEEGDFRITTQKGNLFGVDAITLRPANEAFELRTVLLIGDYGNYPEDEPIEVEIVGDLLARSGQNYKGMKVEVTPLTKGPSISFAEYFQFTADYPFVDSGRGLDCPRNKTNLVVRTVWAGGVRAMNGEELGNDELKNFVIFLKTSRDTVQVTPFQIADTGDNDNNIDLCISESGTPIAVSVEANTAIDPRDDANAFSSAKVISRW